MRRIVSCVLITLLAISCKKSEVAPVAPCLLFTKTTQTTMTVSPAVTTVLSTTVYEYNQSLQLIKSTETITGGTSGISTPLSSSIVEYTYSNGVVASTASGKNVAAWSHVSGRVSKISASEGLATITMDYVYDNEGKLISITYKDNQGGGPSTRVLTYDNSKKLKSITTPGLPASSPDMVTIGSFDTKNNPYSLLAKAINEPYFTYGYRGGAQASYYSNNNYLSAQQGLAQISALYEYNDRDYPTKQTLTFSTGEASTRVYEYKNCN